MGEDRTTWIYLLPSEGFPWHLWCHWPLQQLSGVHLFDECIGLKNTNHLTQYWYQSIIIHGFVDFDNATSTNKTKYLFSWAMETVSSGEINHVHISFTVAGHTKYSDLPGVRKLHNLWWRHTMEMWRWKCTKTSLVSGRIHHFVSESALQMEFQPPNTVSATFTVFQLRKWPTWLPCMTVSFLLIVVQITCHHWLLYRLPPRQHILLLPLQHLQSHLHLEDREKGNRANVQLKAVMDLDTKNEQDGLKVTQQKPDVLGVSKSLVFISHASAHHFTSLPTILTSSFALLLLPDTICPQTADATCCF